MVFDTPNISVNSLRYKYSDHAILPLIENQEPVSKGPIVCIFASYMDSSSTGIFTEQLVCLLHRRKLRVTIEQILMELSVTIGCVGVVDAVSNQHLRFDRMFFGVFDTR
jgi:hypothetical protein